MSSPYFSVIIPALNEEAVLPHLLLDLTQQTHTNFEVIIVDGGSTDKTLPHIHAVQKDHPNFFLESSKKKNVSIQRNTGALLAKGAWLVFLDADSRVDADFLETLQKQLKRTGCDGFTCYAVPDTPSLDAIAYVQMQNILLETMATFGTPYSVGACMGMKKSVFEEVGGFDSSIHHMEDSELAKRMHEYGYIFRVLHTPTYVYSLRRQRKEGKLTIIKKLFPYYIKSMISNEFTTPEELYKMDGGEQFKKVKKA